MRVSFVFPSSSQRTGGVIVLYELANGLARRGHEVHFVHGPAWPTRIDRLEELPPFRFEDAVHHHIVDALDDPSLPSCDVTFAPGGPPSLGLHVVIVQGFRMMSDEWEREAYRLQVPKICVARWLVDVGRSLGVPSEQLLHVPLGMDHDLFTMRTPLHERSHDVAMLYHPHPQKGWDVALAVLEELARRRPGFRAIVFGMAAPSDALPAGVEVVRAPDQRALADRVLNASRVFVQASHHEGFGYTAVEAMACGSALVTTDNGGSRDYALPGQTAVVVPPGDVTGVTDAVEVLLGDDAERARLAAAGERFVRRFDWSRSAALLEGHLERYLDDPEHFRRPPGPIEAAEPQEVL